MINIHKITDPHHDRHLSTILEYENAFVMIDCGLSLYNDLGPYKSSHELLNKVDLLIVTGSEIENCGALLYLINTYNYHVILLEQNLHHTTNALFT